MLTAALLALCPVATAPQETEDFLSGYLDFLDGVELVSPWFDGLSLGLQLERRVETMENGQWTTTGGKSTTIAVKAVRSTDGGRWLLDLTMQDSRSLLADAADAGAVAHRIAGLADGVTFSMLCDDYGVPDTVVEVETTVAALRQRRAALIAGLPAEIRPVAAELVPDHLAVVDEVIDLCEAWCIPIGYYLTEGQPLEFSYYDEPAWSVVNTSREVTYRLEEHDVLAGICKVSCDDRPGFVDSPLVERLEDAGLPGSTPLGPVIVTDWDFDLETNLPTSVKRVVLQRTGQVSTRETLTLAVR